MKEMFRFVLAVLAGLVVVLPGIVTAQEGEWTCDEGPNDIVTAAQVAFEAGDLELALELATEAVDLCQESNRSRLRDARRLKADIQRTIREQATTDPELQPGLAMTTQDLGVFAEADRDSDRLTVVSSGELVNVLETDRKWARIEYEGVEGWSRFRDFGPLMLVNVDGPTPVPRAHHMMAYDVESDRVILWGGNVNRTAWAPINDTWAYDVSTNTWTEMSPPESPRPGEGPLAYDVQSDRAILFLNPAAGSSETWAYDLNTDSWTNLSPSPAPPPMYGARMVYDAESDRMILFGGIRNSAYSNETWVYDYDANTWTNMEPEVRPPGMNYQPMAYDIGADRVVLIGSNAYDITDNTWIYDYNTNTWEMRETTQSPRPRDYSMMVYADAIGQVILYGQGEPYATDDTWAYDFDSNTWTQLNPETNPGNRGWHAMAYSTAAEQIILFGGGRSRLEFTLETWLYDPVANTWTQVGP